MMMAAKRTTAIATRRDGVRGARAKDGGEGVDLYALDSQRGNLSVGRYYIVFLVIVEIM
jgi:hypothetical protein